eukprot:gnl/TRDRNA2_/TRDRNA2_126459_c0_seq2.p2 gnl/TRDRNA2_/TRDRNA2_126459_c0~~gnl/TRDRNA2_/TRDRNA2_126459_c0_seq2.p2  ORF type:complete len:137 (-),score=12.23 gnl/TRDRNA2_/TRDRNA2_126459_c0_seq2:167-577(-)
MYREQMATCVDTKTTVRVLLCHERQNKQTNCCLVTVDVLWSTRQVNGEHEPTLSSPNIMATGHTQGLSDALRKIHTDTVTELFSFEMPRCFCTRDHPCHRCCWAETLRVFASCCSLDMTEYSVEGSQNVWKPTLKS